jgi:hypothetical protein
MSEPNWGLISSGATFEALALTLIRFEDTNAWPFGRPGKDCGQDALSGDAKMVYQAKHHADGSAAKAIADALSEATKIVKYRAVGHPCERQWRGVTRWRLVCNAAFNARNRQRWFDEVVPAFEAQGLTADYWLRPDLNALLAKYPDVYRAFFEQEARAFLSLAEVRERFEDDAPFVRRDALTPYVGRAQQQVDVDAFLTSHELFLVVHGPGGIGKSRFLLEVGERLLDTNAWQILWANIATLSAGTSWFDAVVPERPTILLVDEPDTEQVLKLLSEQLGGRVGRASKWKVIVSVRSPKDPVLHFLSGAKLKQRVRWLLLGELSSDAAQTMCRNLLSTGPLATQAANLREHAIKTLVDRFARQPIWLTLAVHLLETYGDINRIPETASELADLYLEEITGQARAGDPDTIRACLRWVALIGTVNRESDSIVQLIADQTGVKDATALRGLLNRLVERRALVQRGARSRLVELKPDVLRDHLLTSWLIVNVGYGNSPNQPSSDVVALLAPIVNAIEKGGLSDVGRAILGSIARTELLFRSSDKPVALLDPFFKEVTRAISNMSAGGRIALTGVLPDIARLRVRDVVELVGALRASRVQSETVKTAYGRRALTNDDVLLHLAWPIYHAGMGAATLEERALVLNTLCDLALAEIDAQPRLPRKELPNDGKRAEGLIGQTIAGGPYFWSSFEDATLEVGIAWLERLRSGEPSDIEMRVLKALVTPALTVERFEDWVEGDQFVFRKYVITDAHPAWTTRETLVGKIKELLLDPSMTQQSLVVLWGLFTEAHRLANFAFRDSRATLRDRSLDDLRWTRDALIKHGLRFEEMRAARDIWDWHARFDSDDELKATALELESLYAKNDLAADFEPLLEFESVQAHDRNALAAAKKIADAGERGISTFIERGVRFFEEKRRFSSLLSVASQLGSLASEKPAVREFVVRTLQSPESKHHLEFALTSAMRWTFDVRKASGSPRAYELLQELLAHCADEPTKTGLISEVYGTAPPRYSIEELGEEELVFLREQQNLFTRNAQTAAFVGIISPSFTFRWSELRPILESTLEGLAEPTLSNAVAWLIQGVFWGIYQRENVRTPPDFAEWLLDQLVRVADIDALGSMVDFRLDEILKVVGRAPLRWLPKALKMRAGLEAAGTGRAVGYDSSLGQYVEPVRPGVTDPAELRAVLSELLDLVDDQGTVGYRLNEILHDVDPNGLILADIIAERIRNATSESVWPYLRLARSYVVNTTAWRTIALPAIELAEKYETIEERNSVFATISNPGVRTWGGKPGEVGAIFITAVDTARQYRDNEKDRRFLVLWNWYVGIAEAELELEQEDAKEERGE